MKPELEIAVFGGGCFWCIEAAFEQIKGVKSVVSGYAGGSIENPNYDQVCQGNTGHAEVVKVEFDPQKVSYGKLLEIFAKVHDPTSLNQQGPDIGEQYRSIILYTSQKQKQAAQKWKQKTQGAVTEIEPLKKFYKAEKYHQDYFKKNKDDRYCQIVIKPKLEKLQTDLSSK